MLSKPPAATEAGAYALLQLTGIVAACWNGHILYAAATGSSDYERGLQAALEYSAGSLPQQAALWAIRARQTLPEFRFRQV
jgi:hypothetical protein